MAVEEHIPELARLRQISERLVSPELATKIIENLPDALVVVEVPSGRIVLFNGRAEKLFGYARVEVLGETVEILIPEMKRAAHIAHREKYVLKLEDRPMGEDQDLEARHKSGVVIPVLINLSSIVITEGTFVSAAVRRKGA